MTRLSLRGAIDEAIYMKYKIKGMHCASCASMIELDLEDAGIKSKCSYAKEELVVEVPHDSKKVIEVIKKSGYNVG